VPWLSSTWTQTTWHASLQGCSPAINDTVQIETPKQHGIYGAAPRFLSSDYRSAPQHHRPRLLPPGSELVWSETLGLTCEQVEFAAKILLGRRFCGMGESFLQAF
jgi:hypothetical protein